MEHQNLSAESFLQRIKIILVGTTHPGNIGASARAMKVMGLRQLCLVAPKIAPNAQARAMATDASDLLSEAEIVSSLPEALKDCATVFGTTARKRTLQWPVISPREAAAAALSETQLGKLALVFGREDAGLTNEEVGHCHKLIRIPTAAEFSSLNLAQAVQVCTYELQLASLASDEAHGIPAPNPDPWKDPDDPLASSGATDRLYEHWIETMTDTGYFHPENPRLMPQRIRRMLAKARYSVTETQIFRGFLTAVDKNSKKQSVE